MQRKMDASFAYIAHLIKTRCQKPAGNMGNDPMSPTSEGTATSTNMMITDGSNILLGGFDRVRIPTHIYTNLLDRAKGDIKGPARKLAVLLVSCTLIFSLDELRTQNATGKTVLSGTKNRVDCPLLDQEKLGAICRQVKMEFPLAKIRVGDSSCGIMQAINGVCRKKRASVPTAQVCMPGRHDHAI